LQPKQEKEGPAFSARAGIQIQISPEKIEAQMLFRGLRA